MHITTSHIKYIIYARKSSEGEDRQMLSIEGQLGELRKVIERDKLHVIDTYSESKSAHVPNNRAKFDTMLKRIRKGHANGIICWHLNRLSRNPKESGELQQLLQDGNIRSIVTPYRQYRSEDNALLFSIETSEANQYSRDLSTNVKRGLRQKIELGWPPGIAPVGYLNTKSSIKGSNTIVPDPDRWPIIRRGFDLLLSGAHTAPRIVEILNTEYGLRTRPGKVSGNKPLARSAMYRIFTDPFYYGYFYRQGILHKGAYKPMITAIEYEQVQFILGRNGKPKAKKHVFPFTGLMKCGECGCAITAERKIKQLKTTGQFKTYELYHCTRKKSGHPKCNQKRCITSAILESEIESKMRAYQVRPFFKEWGLRILNENFAEESAKRGALIEHTFTEETKLQKELNALLDLRISGEISMEMFTEKKNERENALIKIQHKKKEMEERANNWKQEVVNLLTFTLNIAERFKNGDMLLKKQLCHAFGSNWILKDEKLFIDISEWLEPIRKYNQGIESTFGKLEPEKTFMDKGQKSSIQLLSPIVLGLEDDVRTSLQKIRTESISYQQD